MGLDPGYRTGCKVAVVDATGRVLDTGVIYPTHSKVKVQEGKQVIKDMIAKHGVTVIAIETVLLLRKQSCLPQK